jgi:perosamine synthetase
MNDFTRWPVLDSEVEEAVVAQLHSSISIYDRSGVIETFETEFAKMHGCRHALMTSSGTAALHSAYFALGISEGDEVLVPAYTFFATAMPLFQTQAQPVLVDAGPDGFLSLEEAALLLTKRTRAMVICHVWGTPHPVLRYRKFCDEHGIALIEDCSHSAGASWAGYKVGALSDIAIWSLQASKQIPAGEGGVLCTNSDELYYRSTVLGHFNRRSLQTIPPEDPMFYYATTGAGLKYRVHPLGAAIALVFLRRLDSYTKIKLKHEVSLRKIMELSVDLFPLYEADSLTVSANYAFPFLCAPGVDPASWISTKNRSDFAPFDHPGTTRSLSSFAIFREPGVLFPKLRSSIRRPLRMAEELSNRIVKIPVPHVENSESAEFIERVGDLLLGKRTSRSSNKLFVETWDAKGSVAMANAALDGIESFSVGAVACDDAGSILLLRRVAGNYLSGSDDLPGGFLETGELLTDALKREFFEETGGTVAAIVSYIGSFDYLHPSRGQSRQFNFIVRANVPTSPILSRQEHSSAIWIPHADFQSSLCTPETKKILETASIYIQAISSTTELRKYESNSSAY